MVCYARSLLLLSCAAWGISLAAAEVKIYFLSQPTIKEIDRTDDADLPVFAQSTYWEQNTTCGYFASFAAEKFLNSTRNKQAGDEPAGEFFEDITNEKELREFFKRVQAPPLYHLADYEDEPPAVETGPMLNQEGIEKNILPKSRVLRNRNQCGKLLFASRLDYFDHLPALSKVMPEEEKKFKRKVVPAFNAGERIGILWWLDLPEAERVGLDPVTDYSEHIIFVGVQRDGDNIVFFVADSALADEEEGLQHVHHMEKHLWSLIEQLWPNYFAEERDITYIEIEAANLAETA